MVRFIDAFTLIWDTCKNEWSKSRTTKGFVQEMAEYISLTKRDFACIIFIGLLITLIRKTVTANFLQPLSKKLKFTAKDTANFPESSFKFIVYLALYVAECYVLLVYYREFVTDPQSAWKGWHVGMDVPPNIYWIYVTEAGFYIHGIYGTICMDVWRDDSVMLILHHILTISLVVFSLGLRYHNMGLVVLFLHDIADVFLEFTKVVKCFQNRDRSKKSVHSFVTSLGFVFFASAWIGCRIIVYPIIVLYSTGYEARKVLPDAPFYFFFNGLLWILFCMNVWWSYFIVLLIFRIIVGKSESIEDTRELSLSDEQFMSNGKRGDLRKRVKKDVANGTNGFTKNGNTITKENGNKAEEHLHAVDAKAFGQAHHDKRSLLSNEIRKRN